jgi:3-oxoacyl-[acyl-carrier-protein] synthase-3
MAYLYIHGIGHYRPENVIDNAFLEEIGIGTTNEWIVTRTGIETRRTVLPLDYIRATGNRDPRCADEVSLLDNAETGYRAAVMALRRANLETSDIGLVVAGGSAPRMGSPAEACLIAAQLGMTVPCLDINSACSTFAVQMRLLSQMSDLPDYVLVVNPENLTRAVDYTDRATAVLMGDCTSAAVVSLKHPARCRVAASTMQTDAAGWRKVTIRTGGHLQQDGHAVQNFAIRGMACIVERMRPGAPFQFVGHQANLPMLRSVCQRTGVEESAHLHNVERFGNCGAAGMPSVLSEHWDTFRAGDTVLAAVVGAGLTSAGLLLEFAEATRQ